MIKIMTSLLARLGQPADEWSAAVKRHAPELVLAAYRATLGRDPDPPGMRHWTRFLRKPGNTYEMLLTGFLRSPEYRRMQAEAADAALVWRPDASGPELSFLVMGNCQAGQMARCIQALTGGPAPTHEFVNLHGLDQIKEGKRDLRELFDGHQKILLQPWLWDAIKSRYVDCQQKVVLYPAVGFTAFHPDLVYILRSDTGGHFRGPCKDYNSSIALLGWKAGLSASQTLELFTAEVFKRLGFFDWWDQSRIALKSEGDLCGLQLEPLLDRWRRQGCFMHSINHPKIHVTADIARMLLGRLEVPLRPGNPAEYAYDYLADSYVWPVYPELSEHLGLPAPQGYSFKLEAPGFVPDSPVQVIDLQQFVQSSFAAFAAHRPEDLICPRLDTTAYRQLLVDLQQRGLDILAKPSIVANPSSANSPHSHPYKGLPGHQFWRSGVHGISPEKLDPVVRARFQIDSQTRVATAGSCFAQHIARHLSAGGFQFLRTEAATVHPNGLDDGYSAQCGNIYTAAQLLQLIQRAYGEFRPEESGWSLPGGRYADPFRPSFEVDGFASIDELKAAQLAHLAAVRRMFETLDVFVFTLGLTEAWRAKADGAVFPLAPGVAAGEMDPASYEFVNYTEIEVADHLQAFLERLRRVNPGARMILTVSPVALSASYVDRHVLVSNAYSKAALRVAAERIVQNNACCDYFPSYEIITGNFNRGSYYGEDLRTITQAGVNHVMQSFFRHYTSPGVVAVRPVDAEFMMEAERAIRLICEEELLVAAVF